MAKKKATKEDMTTRLVAKVKRLKTKLAAAVEGVGKRKARKKVKRTQRRKRALTPKAPKKKS